MSLKLFGVNFGKESYYHAQDVTQRYLDMTERTSVPLFQMMDDETQKDTEAIKKLKKEFDWVVCLRDAEDLPKAVSVFEDEPFNEEEFNRVVIWDV